MPYLRSSVPVGNELPWGSALGSDFQRSDSRAMPMPRRTANTKPATPPTIQSTLFPDDSEVSAELGCVDAFDLA